MAEEDKGVTTSLGVHHLGHFRPHLSGSRGPLLTHGTASVEPLTPPLTQESLKGLDPVRKVEGRNATKADVFFYLLPDGTRVAVKSYAGRPLFVRHLLGRWLTRRESAAYRAANGAAGLPEFHGRLDSFSLALEWIESRSLAELRGQSVDPVVFEEVRGILDTLHESGLALGDLHHRDVLVADDGHAFLVDLATAWVLGDRPGPLRRAIYEIAKNADRVGLARVEARFLGLNEAEAIAGAGEEAARWHRRGRRFKGWVDRLRGRGKRSQI